MICVGSGKGGVGKSTLTVNLAAALTAEGKRVGVLDADVWGYSIPRMLGIGAERPQVSPERKIVPHVAHGISVMSIGFFIEEDAAVVWRGPMLHKALTQFLEDVEWGELDFLLVDLPPGTGDVSMTLAQLLPQAKFLIVTTPQPTAQKVARALGRDGAQGLARDRERRRDMAGFRPRPASASRSSAREAARRWPTSSTCRSSAASRSRCRCASRRTRARRWSSPTGRPAAQAIRHAARGLVALAPVELPVLQAAAPAEAPKPVGMSLPMA